jgi:hypothetical protein
MATPFDLAAGWKAEAALIGLLLTTGALLAVAIYAPIDNELVSSGIWTALLMAAVTAVWLYVELLRSFDATFFSLPSTWLMMLNLGLLTAFAISFNDGQSTRYPNLAQALFLIGSVVCIVVSVVKNVRRTNAPFGLTLTLVQFLFLPLAIAGCVLAFMAKASESVKTGRRETRSTSTTTTQSQDEDRLRLM